MAAQSRPYTVILTRPAEQGAHFADQLRRDIGASIRVIESPLLVPKYLQPVLPDVRWSAVIFTSVTAVAAIARLGAAALALPRKAYCVGDRTAEVARNAGFQALSARGDAGSLRACIQAEHEPGPLLHLRGQISYGDVAKSLCLAGIETVDVIIYAQIAQPFSTDAKAAFWSDCPVILPVFSSRTGQIVSKELSLISISAPIFLVSISPNVRESLFAISAAGRFVAERPDAASMLMAIQEALIAAQAA